MLAALFAVGMNVYVYFNSDKLARGRCMRNRFPGCRRRRYARSFESWRPAAMMPRLYISISATLTRYATGRNRAMPRCVASAYPQ